MPDKENHSNNDMYARYYIENQTILDRKDRNLRLY